MTVFSNFKLVAGSGRRHIENLPLVGVLSVVHPRRR